MVYGGTAVAMIAVVGVLTLLIAKRNQWRRNEFQAEARSVGNIMRQDPAVLKTACESMLRNRLTYRNDLRNPPSYNEWPTNTVILDFSIRPYELKVPQVILDLNPVWAEIDPDGVFILVDRDRCWRKVALYAGDADYSGRSIELVDGLRIVLRDGYTLDELTSTFSEMSGSALDN